MLSSCKNRLALASILVLSIGALPVSAAQSTTAIEGVVTDPAGAVVAGATVELVVNAVTTSTTSSDGEGRYRFEGVEPGEYAVRVTARGFQPRQRRVSAAASESVTVDLRLSLQTLEESLLVTADRSGAEVEAERALTPGGVTILDAEELTRRPINGLADTLRYVPGVWAESNHGSDELFFSSRGSNLDSTAYDKNGIKLLQDGLPVTTADGNNHNRIVDPLSASNTIVARGANALTYGASTLGGAIDLVSPTARNSAPLSGYLNTGSHGMLTGRATAGGVRGDFDGLATLEGKEWGGYREHSEQERWGFYGNGGWQVSDGADLRLFATYVDNTEQLPGALTRDEVAADPDQASEAAIAGDYGKEVETARLAARTAWSVGSNGSLTAGLSYEEQSLFHPIVDRIFVDFDGPGPNPPVEVFSLLVDTDHRDFGAVARYDHATEAHDLLFGVNYGDGSVEGGNYRNNGGRPNGISEYVDNSADSLEAFAVDRWRVADSWTLVFGAQFVRAARDVRTTNATTGALSNPAETYSSVNPRFGVIAALSETTEIYGNVSRLFEAPTTFEMEDDVRGGNATLDAMKGNVVEVGVRSSPTRSGNTTWSWDVTAYYASISDEILSVDDPNAPGNSLTTNVDKTIHAGLEGLVRASVSLGGSHRIEPLVSVSINQFEFDGDPVYGDNDLPAAPTYAVRGELLYQHDAGFYGGPTFDFIGRRYADFANTYTVDGYGLAGLRAGFSARRWDLFGEVRNLFDEDTIATVTVLNEAPPDARVLYPGAPLSVYVGARFSY